jgi:dienelactone hydrolase
MCDNERKRIGMSMMSFREQVLQCLGRFPEKAALQAEVSGSCDLGTHLLRTVRYQAEPDETVTAYLLVPKDGQRQHPAIVACHQHAGEYHLGKSEPAGLSRNTMYHYGLELCLRGYVVLCPDHLGFEDRRPPEYVRVENPALNGSQYERFIFTQRLLQGSTLQAKYLSDLSRGIDFLETLADVDCGRIGTIGHSLGGQQALWLTWYDPRIKAGVSSCGFSQMRSILREGINHNFAAYTIGLLNIGDISDVVCDMAPRPFLMTSGTRDGIFPQDGIREISEAAVRAYRSHGAADCFRSLVFAGEHSFPAEIRQEAYGWLDRFLKT